MGSSVVSGVEDFENTYSYDGYGRLFRVSQGSHGGNAIAPKTVTFSYNAANQLTDLRRYRWPSASAAELDVHSRYAYDGAGRLESISHAKSEIATGETWDGTSTLATSLQGGAVLAAYFMEYDQENRLASWASYADAFESTFSYDIRDQLTGATHAQISGLTLPRAMPSSESYAFDGTGNRELSATSTSTDGSHNQVQNDGTYTYTYDSEGNQTSRTEIATGAVTEYAFDYRNRLIRVTERASAAGAATSVVEFQYDAFDRRTGKEADLDGDGDIDRATAWAWDGNQVVLQYADADGDGPAYWKLTNRYLYGEAIDQVLADEQLPGDGISLGSATLTRGEILWPLADHLGSVRDLVDTDGMIREHLVYDSFGNRLSESDYDASGNSIASTHASAVDHLFGYTGREWDADVELQYNRARWYDPTQGRWISQDPIGFAAGDVNLYRYVGNGVTTSTDPSGLVDPDHPPVDPQPWPSAKPDIPRGSILTGSNMITHPLDDWGLPTGMGIWPPSYFFEYSHISPEQANYGCGGLMAMRIGLKENYPQQLTWVRGAIAFGNLSDAMRYLRDILHGNGLIVAAEQNSAIKRFADDSGPALEGNYQCPATEVNFHSAFNYRSLLGTPEDWYWEHASGPWTNTNKGRVLHNRSGFSASVVFIVVPDAASRSPIVPHLMNDTHRRNE